MKNKTKNIVKNKSWTARVQKVYASLEELKNYDSIYGVARRCGYSDCERFWADNPKIGGSVNPSDFGLVE